MASNLFPGSLGPFDTEDSDKASCWLFQFEACCRNRELVDVVDETTGTSRVTDYFFELCGTKAIMKISGIMAGAGQDMTSSLFSDIKAAVVAYSKPKSRPVFTERSEFLHLTQDPEEQERDFLIRLNLAYSKGDWSSLSEAAFQAELVRICFVDGLLNGNVRRKIVDTFQVNDAMSAQEIAQLCETDVYTQMPMSTDEAAKPKSENSGSTKQFLCNFCATKHARHKCPAYGKVCAKCGKPNHSAEACRSAPPRDTSNPRATAGDVPRAPAPTKSNIGDASAVDNIVTVLSSMGSLAEKIVPQQEFCDRCGTMHAPRCCPAYGFMCEKCGNCDHFADRCRQTANNAAKCVGPQQQRSPEWCSRCDTTHVPGSRFCPAFGKNCQRCGIANHVASRCVVNVAPSRPPAKSTGDGVGGGGGCGCGPAPPRGPQGGAAKAVQPEWCSRCDTTHEPKRNCPAFGRKCERCGIVGHLATRCVVVLPVPPPPSFACGTAPSAGKARNTGGGAATTKQPRASSATGAGGGAGTQKQSGGGGQKPKSGGDGGGQKEKSGGDGGGRKAKSGGDGGGQKAKSGGDGGAAKPAKGKPQGGQPPKRN